MTRLIPLALVCAVTSIAQQFTPTKDSGRKGFIFCPTPRLIGARQWIFPFVIQQWIFGHTQTAQTLTGFRGQNMCSAQPIPALNTASWTQTGPMWPPPTVLIPNRKPPSGHSNSLLIESKEPPRVTFQQTTDLFFSRRTLQWMHFGGETWGRLTFLHHPLM